MATGISITKVLTYTVVVVVAVGLDLNYILDEVSDDEVDELEELLRIKNNINKKIKR